MNPQTLIPLAALRCAVLAGAVLALPAGAQNASPAEPLAANAVAPVEVAPVEAAPLAEADDNAAERALDAAARAEPQEEVLPYYRRVGDATRRLLALQRDGEAASPVPRPVSGEVAQRSRERYLKSFEREIPERFQSSVASKPAGR